MDEPRNDLYALLPHPTRDAALGLFSPAPALPSAQVDGRMELHQVERVKAALEAVIGMPFNVLRCLAYQRDAQAQHTGWLYLLETRPEAQVDAALAPNAGWISLEDLGMLAAPVPAGLRAALAGWLNEQRTKTSHVLRAPWAFPGWYAQAESWIAAQVERLGEAVLAVEPLKSWGISVVLRVQTTTRVLYFKATLDLPLFVNEGVVMSHLARIYPGSVPMPLAVEPERGWMLLADLGKPLGRLASIDEQARVFQAMARLQIDSCERVQTLLNLGCIDRRIPWLQDRLESLMSDAVSMSRMEPGEIDSLRRALPALHAMLAELDALPVPPALVHGDLHTGNVALVGGRVQFFDWTDAAVSHPFFDLLDIYPTEDAARRMTLETAYRAEWERVYPVEAVRRAFELARVVYGLHHAVSYQVLVNRLEEPERENLNGAHFFLRQVLAGLARFS